MFSWQSTFCNIFAIISILGGSTGSGCHKCGETLCSVSSSYLDSKSTIYATLHTIMQTKNWHNCSVEPIYINSQVLMNIYDYTYTFLVIMFTLQFLSQTLMIFIPRMGSIVLFQVDREQLGAKQLCVEYTCIASLFIFKATFSVRCMTFLNFLYHFSHLFLYMQKMNFYKSLRSLLMYFLEIKLLPDYICKSHDHDHQWADFVMAWLP